MSNFKLSGSGGEANTKRPSFNPNMGYITGFVAVPRGTEISTEANAKLLATYTTGCNAAEGSRWYPFPKLFKFEPNNEDDIFEEGDGGAQEFVRAGSKSGTKGMWVNIPPSFKKNLRAFNEGTWSAYYLTSRGYILGISKDDTKFLPIPVYLRIEKELLPTGDETWKTKVHIYDEDPEVWDDYGEAVKPTAFTMQELIDEAIEDVDITESGTPSAAGVEVTLTNAHDGSEITGAVVGDFNVTGLASVSSVGNVYSLVPTSTFSSPLSVDLHPQPTATTKGRESTGSISISF